VNSESVTRNDGKERKKVKRREKASEELGRRTDGQTYREIDRYSS